MLLSERIEERLKRCKRCGGTGSYRDAEIGPEEWACLDCSDWLTTLKGVKELESEVKRLQNLASATQ